MNFKWANLASYNAGVTVNIVGISRNPEGKKGLYNTDKDGKTILKQVDYINAYLIAGENIIIQASPKPLSELAEMNFGNMANDEGHLILTKQEAVEAVQKHNVLSKYIRPFYGSQEFINGNPRYCIWVNEFESEFASPNLWLSQRFDQVKKARLKSDRSTTQALAKQSYRFGEVRQKGNEQMIVVPSISSENRPYLPCGLLQRGIIVSNKNFALFDVSIWNLALIASRLHWVWIGTVCVRMRTDFSYSNTLGWNTFPVPVLTTKNKEDLKACAEEILIARERHFPATIADLYDPERMPEDLRQAHERNDEVLERIYIGRRFKNDTERLEKLFELYTEMTTKRKAV